MGVAALHLCLLAELNVAVSAPVPTALISAASSAPALHSRSPASLLPHAPPCLYPVSNVLQPHNPPPRPLAPSAALHPAAVALRAPHCGGAVGTLRPHSLAGLRGLAAGGARGCVVAWVGWGGLGRRRWGGMGLQGSQTVGNRMQAGDTSMGWDGVGRETV